MRAADISVAEPAATVVVLREGDRGCEILLVRRSTALSSHGGAWVFPGGRLDAADYAAAGDDPVEAARFAAVREAHEEAGLQLDPGALVPMSRWITPAGAIRRFDTWFFAAHGGDAAVQVDGAEIDQHRWLEPASALEAQRTGAMMLPPPTFVTLIHLRAYRRAAEALAAFGDSPIETFAPRLLPAADGAVTVYGNDAAFADGDLDRPGPRHRLWMLTGGWRYEREE